MIKVSECFYSIQGEGKTAGVAAVFLRVAGCNLTCGGVDTVRSGGLDSGASWRCDTIETWLKGDLVSSEDLVLDWEGTGFLDALGNGAHLVVTGGEPLLQENGIFEFLNALDDRLGRRVFVEMETNGTLAPGQGLGRRVDQFNVSPKLGNSGMGFAKRVSETAMSWFSECERAVFKFVVSDAGEWKEISETYLSVFGIDKSRVFLMPGCESREQFLKEADWVSRLCMREGVWFSPRLQLVIWDETVGV